MPTTRDHTKLRVFGLADTLVVDVYRSTARLPDAEHYGLQAQVRRAAVSVPTNIVEGCAGPSTSEYCRFLSVATASAAETQYLISLASRLGMLPTSDTEPIAEPYTVLVKSLKRLLTELQARS